jgi:hypothetical protein
MKATYLFKLALQILFIAATITQASGIFFPRERVDATICSKDTLQINGVYWFANKTNKAAATNIYFPFAIDSFSLFPHYIELTNLSAKKPVKFNALPKGIQWKLSLEAGAVDSFLVVYRQKTSNMSACYIVTSALMWGRPLETADFSVKVPSGIVLDYWSFRCDSVVTQKDTLIYNANYSPFSPVADMLMRWHTAR